MRIIYIERIYIERTKKNTYVCNNKCIDHKLYLI